jgi:tRNA-intron endonuclease
MVLQRVMQVSGELIGDRIQVTKPKQASRLHNRGRFGHPLSDNRLSLDLLEGVYLVDEGKLVVYQKNTALSFQDLVQISVKKIPVFERCYLVFKDLRSRGYVLYLEQSESSYPFFLCNMKKNGTQKESHVHLYVFSERDIFDIHRTLLFIKQAVKKNSFLWFAIVDEEGDITYYEVSNVELQGAISDHHFSRGRGMVLNDRVVIFDPVFAQELFEKEFFGKPFGNGLQLSLVEALYLFDKKIIDLFWNDKKTVVETQFHVFCKKLEPDIDLRRTVFGDLKQRGLIVKTGFKFGAHFRAYTSKPEETHAEYLVHVMEKDFSSTWAEMSRAVRLAHSVNKEIVFASLQGTSPCFLRFGRLRP